MTTWILSNTRNIANLVEIAGDGPITVVTVGEEDFPGIDRVRRVTIEPGTPEEAAAPAVAAAVDAAPGDVVLAPNQPAERVYAGVVAAHLNAPLLVGLKQLSDGSATLSRYGGLSHETVSFDTAVAIVDGGAELDSGETPEAEAVAGDVYVATVSAKDTSDTVTTNISAATRVVGCGRGFAEREDLQLAHDLAEAIGGEVGCTRPLAEGVNWMERNSYIGVSGHVIAPELYIAVGLSGQIHHTAGVLDSGTIVAINDDELASIFEIADYGIVGDLYEVLPKLTEALRK